MQLRQILVRGGVKQLYSSPKKSLSDTAFFSLSLHVKLCVSKRNSELHRFSQCTVYAHSPAFTLAQFELEYREHQTSGD